MDGYVELMRIDDLEDGKMKAVEVEGHEVLVAKVEGTVYATDGRCPHMHAHLVKGTLDGTTLTCPWHGSQFDISDGRVIRWTKYEGAVQSVAEFVRHPRPLRTYEVVLKEGIILMGPENEPPNAS